MNQRTKLASALLVFALVFSLTAWSQESQPPTASSRHASLASYQQSPERFFRLTFRVLQISPEGKVIDGKSYDETVVSGTKSEKTSSIRTMDRVPVFNSDCGNSGTVSCKLSQVVSMGTNIDVQEVEIVGDTLHLHVTADLSTTSFKPPAKPEFPIHRDTRWNSYAIVPINKPTLIFSGDDNADKGKTELELTAVPIGQ